MGTFDSIYQQKIRQLEEENKQLKLIINEGRISNFVKNLLFTLDLHPKRKHPPHRDTPIPEKSDTQKEIERRQWAEAAAQRKLGYTHGLNGEYGNPAHDKHQHPEYLEGRLEGTVRRVYGDKQPDIGEGDASMTAHYMRALAKLGLDERGAPIGTDHDREFARQQASLELRRTQARADAREDDPHRFF